jgi:hypothetical protein
LPLTPASTSQDKYWRSMAASPLSERTVKGQDDG